MDSSIVGVLATVESESVVEAQPFFSDGGISDSYLNYYSHILQSQKPTDLQKSKETFSKKIVELQLLVISCTIVEAIHSVSVHHTSALSIVKSADVYQPSPLIIRSNQPLIQIVKNSSVIVQQRRSENKYVDGQSPLQRRRILRKTK